MKQKLKILHLSSHDSGGAGRAATHLHRGMRTLGIDSRMLVMNKLTKDLEIRGINLDFIQKFKLILNKIYLKIFTNSIYGYQNLQLSFFDKIKSQFDTFNFKPDIVIVHNISHFVSMRDLVKLCQKIDSPVIFNLLDMSQLTGGCHYAWDCRGYEKRCESCPAQGLINRDKPIIMWSKKHEALKSLRGAVVTPTSSLMDQTQKSTLFSGWPIKKIMLSVDPRIFFCGESETGRLKFSLPLEDRIIYFGAVSLGQKRKGMSYLVTALNILFDKGIFDGGNIVVAFSGKLLGFKNIINSKIPIHYLGYLQNDEELAFAYNAADIFISPSVEDSGPMMINESMMCGTPVVSFPVGVARDLISEGKTGFIANSISGESLAFAIEKALLVNKKTQLDMSKSCREIALASCTPEIQVAGFLELSKALVS